MYISVRHMILKERRSKKKNLSNSVRKAGTNLSVFRESPLIKKCLSSIIKAWNTGNSCKAEQTVWILQKKSKLCTEVMNLYRKGCGCEIRKWRKEKSDLFIQYWKKQYKTYQRIQKDLPKEHQRYQEIDQILKLIEGELNESLWNY